MAEEGRKGNTFVSRKSVQLPRGRGDVVHCIEECKQRYDGGHDRCTTVALGCREEYLDVWLSGGAGDRLLNVAD